MRSIFRVIALIAGTGLFSTTETSAGSIARLYYDGIPGATVASLTNAEIFPDAPTFREQLDDFSPTASGELRTGFQGKENTGNNFGSCIRGYLEAPESGDYVFFIASDDASELWLSTDTAPANQRLVAAEPTGGAALFSTVRLEERSSDPIPLVRGEKYYLEVLHKQATGPSYIEVGWERPDGVREIIPARHLFQHPIDPYLGRGEPNLPPIFNDAGANGGDLPATVSAEEGSEVVLELDVIAAQPVTIQWRRNGVAIPGENLSFLRLNGISASYSGQRIDAIVSNQYGTLTSTAAQISVTPDTTPPEVVTVDHRGDPNSVRVTYSERVSEATATDLANYTLRAGNGSVLPIAEALLLPDEQSVQLKGAFQFEISQSYTLSIQNVEDRAASPNRIAAGEYSFVFRGEFTGPIGFAPDNPLRDQSVVENRVARFEVALSGAQPWFYQWHWNGSPITGATNAVLEVIANSQSVGAYSVTVSNEFSSATSDVVQLSITPDVTPPSLVRVRGVGGGINEVELTFDEPLAQASATNVNNYWISDLSILQAAVSEDGLRVTLRTSPQENGKTYLVALIGVLDRAVVGNMGKGTASFISEVSYPGEVLADGPVRYWRFSETEGSTVSSKASLLDPLSGTEGTLVGDPNLGVPSLVPSEPTDGAIEFSAASSQRILVPNGSDLNAVAGPWARKSFEFWFKAHSVPAPDSSGLQATAGIWEQGAASRSFAVYLWRDPVNPNPSEAELVLHSFNDVADGPGSPFGLLKLPAVFVQHTITVGETYHVVAVFDGDSAGTDGELILYVNGDEVARAGGVGQVYNHTGDVQIGRGNGIIHTGENGDFGFFDGVLDELAVYNKALSAARVERHYRAGLGNNPPDPSPLAIARVESRGNPNELLVTFSKPVQASTAANLANYSLRAIPNRLVQIESADLLPGELTVRLSGPFAFAAGETIELQASSITDQATPPRSLEPSPAVASVVFETNGAVQLHPSSVLASRSAVENEVVRFQAVPAGTGPFHFQWFLNGEPLTGANQSELELVASAATAGTYRVVVKNEFSEVTSSNIVLTVGDDLAAPQVIGALGLGGSVNEVRITFDEELDPVTAANAASYQVSRLQVIEAILEEDGRSVTLLTSPQELGASYMLAISGVKDRSAAGNVLSGSFSFTSTVSYADEILADGPVRYWQFEETSGTEFATLTTVLDDITTAGAKAVNELGLGVAGLVPNLLGGKAIQFSAVSSNRLAVPNGSDLNAVAGPWAKKTIQFWFKATSVPAPGTTGLAATAGIWEQGAATRTIAVYLWRDPENQNPNQAELVFHVANNAVDGAGAPFGPPADPAVFARATISAGEVYHVAAVLDGDDSGLAGTLILYLNGVEADRATGVGQVYNHTGDVRIGHGASLIHTGENGDYGYFDGILDELALYNRVLTAERIAELYQFGLHGSGSGAPARITGIRIQDGNIVVSWEGGGRLGASQSVNGPFVEIPNASNPYSEPVSEEQRYFQVIP